jgi:hypothetical protein
MNMLTVNARIVALRQEIADLERFRSNCACAFEDCITPSVPEGFDTVLGWLAKHHPDVLVLLGDVSDPQATVRDGWRLAHWCKREGKPVLWVEAPAVLQERGIEKVRAYPVSLLKRRWR